MPSFTELTLQCRVLPNLTLQCRVLPNLTLQCRVLPNLTLQCRVLPNLILQCRVLPNLTLRCRVLLNLTLQCRVLPNVTVEWLALLIHIWNVPSSNLGPETVCPEVFRCLPQSFQANAGITLWSSYTSEPLPANSLGFHVPLYTFLHLSGF
jgi:hypothetical protein